MLAQDSPHEEIRARAKRAVDEVKLLAVGKPAPVISGRDAAAQVFSLSDYRGKVVLLVIRNSPRVREYETLLRRLEERGLVVLGILTEGAVWRTWRKGEPLAARWNALERARHYVIDREGVIRGKDLLPDDLKRLLAQLLTN
jgi:peroxiredoxin